MVNNVLWQTCVSVQSTSTVQDEIPMFGLLILWIDLLYGRIPVSWTNKSAAEAQTASLCLSFATIIVDHKRWATDPHAHVDTLAEDT